MDPIFSAARIAKLTPLFYKVAYQVIVFVGCS